MLTDFGKKAFIKSNGREFACFTASELDFLLKSHESHTDKWIGEALCRSESSIRSKRHKMGLVKYEQRQAKRTVDKILLDEVDYTTQREISALVNFIETTSSDVLREIANTRRKELIKNSKR